MTAPPPRRPWWRRKRWAAAGVLWLAVAYVASTGPVLYAEGRGWLSEEVTGPLLLPASLAAHAPFVGRRFGGYMRRCFVRGLEDDGYQVEVDAAGNITATDPD